MVDDMQSFVAAAELLKERGAHKIYVLATHGLLSSDAPKLIEESHIDEVCNYSNNQSYVYLGNEPCYKKTQETFFSGKFHYLH